MHDVEVYVKEKLLVQALSLESNEDSIYIFDRLYFIQHLISFPSIDHVL